jgi:elongation of very long chain fatty acids protein 7
VTLLSAGGAPTSRLFTIDWLDQQVAAPTRTRTHTEKQTRAGTIFASRHRRIHKPFVQQAQLLAFSSEDQTKMSRAEASLLLVDSLRSDSQGRAGLQQAAADFCSNLARRALERNCLLSAELSQVLASASREHNHHDHFTSHYIIELEQSSSLNNVTSTSMAAAAQHAAACQQRHFGLEQPAPPLLAGGAESPLTSLVTNHLLGPMQQLESKVNYYFSDIWLASGDERTNKLPFIGAGPWKLIYATLIYLYLIKWLLPRLMQPFRPLELNWLIRLYNLFMVLSNMWSFYHGARILKFGLKCFGCETINHQDHSAQAIELLHYGWLFFLSRLIEWLDTIFFVLRKKERQVTKLHVFHHSFVPLISWTYLKYHPGYTVAFFPFVNSFVHSIMYTYYLLATFGPKVQPYLWWKRYLTSLQIAQFVLIIIQLASIPLTGDESCQYPRGFLYVAFAGAILFLWLFYTYYLDTYTRGAKSGPRGATCEPRQQQQQREPDDRLAFGLSRLGPAAAAWREGSSRSLSDVVENAISCDEPPASLSPASRAGGLRKPKLS